MSFPICCCRARDVEGLRLVISTDSHHTSEFDNIQWGVANARRGWVRRDTVINTLPLEQFLEFVAVKKERLS